MVLKKAEVMIKLDQIRADDSIQSREGINWQKVEEYAELMACNTAFPAVQLFSDEDGVLWLGEGFHRVAATRKSGKDEILAIVEPGGRRSALLASIGANADHGIPRTHGDKRRAVRLALQLDKEEKSDLKDREIARMTHTSHPFVAQERAAFNSPALAGQLQDTSVSSRQALADTAEEESLKNPERPAPFAPPTDDDDDDEPQQMNLFGPDTAPVSTALQQSYGKPAPAAPAFIFATEEDFIKAARAAVVREKKESADNDEWITPQELWDALNEEFQFTLDVAATAANAKCTRYIDKTIDALSQSWAQGPGDDGAGWMNHPYTLTDEFMGKAFQTAMSGERTMVCLPKVDTETHWWWKYARYGQVRLLRGRLTFSNASSPARFANAVIIFPKDMAKPGYKPSVSHWDWKGDWNAELPQATSQAIKQGGVVLEDRAFFQQPEDFERPDAPLIWTPYKAPEQKGKRKAG